MTTRLLDAGHQILSPLENEEFRSAETLVAFADPPGVVARLVAQGVIVTEKPEGIRVATDFFNNEEDIDRLIEGLALTDVAQIAGWL